MQDFRGRIRSREIAGLPGSLPFRWMTVAPEPDAGEPDIADVERRTWLAAERTWLAWWRTGLGAAAVSIGVGRLLPGLTGGARLPLRLLGLGYGLVAVAILVIGAVRQRRVAAALRRGDYEELSSPMVMWLTAAAVALAVATLLVIALAI
jgi:putative membrane protein